MYVGDDSDGSTYPKASRMGSTDSLVSPTNSTPDTSRLALLRASSSSPGRKNSEAAALRYLGVLGERGEGKKGGRGERGGKRKKGERRGSGGIKRW